MDIIIIPKFNEMLLAITFAYWINIIVSKIVCTFSLFWLITKWRALNTEYNPKYQNDIFMVR